jgi:predicted TIM-barrel fold metal-dependent hydrolase
MLPVADVGAAVTELASLCSSGFRAVCLPARVAARPYNDPAYDALWAAIQDAGVPATFHSGTGYEPRLLRGPGGAIVNYILGAQLDGPTVLLQLAAGGALDRFPGLRAVTVETGAAWLAWIMTQADAIYEAHREYVRPKLSLRPSELIRRQCHATFMDDAVAVRNRDITGVEPLLWGNDYPHPEGTWPDSAAAHERQFAGVPPADVAAMVAGNASRVFGFVQPLAGPDVA